MSSEFTREQLFAYLDDELDDSVTSLIEKKLRDSSEFRKHLERLRESRDRGEHSVGAVWRRERLSCLTREQLTGFLHGVLDANQAEYIEFHLKTIGCSSCGANLEDLKDKQSDSSTSSKRRKKYFETSAGLLNDSKK